MGQIEEGGNIRETGKGRGTQMQEQRQSKMGTSTSRENRIRDRRLNCY